MADKTPSLAQTLTATPNATSTVGSVGPVEQKPPEAAVASNKTMSITEMIERGIRKRNPMSTAALKMTVPAIDGYYLYWFAARNMQAALEAGYEFVQNHEVNLVNTGIATDHSLPGHTDLGSRVSMVGDTVGPDNQGPQRAYLMKIRQAWRDEDRAALDAKNASIMGAIFKGEQVYGAEGKTRPMGREEYIKTALFNRPVRKAKIVR